MSRRLILENRNLRRVVTHTTRKPRLGERSGKDYIFLDEPDFKKGITLGRYAEWAKVHGRYYGVPLDGLEAVLKRGGIPVLVIDVQGAAAIKRKFPSAVLVFLLPPDWDSLEKRLSSRGDNTEDMAGRLATARREIARIGRYDYLVINDKIFRAVKDLEGIIRAETLRTGRKWPSLRPAWIYHPLSRRGKGRGRRIKQSKSAE